MEKILRKEIFSYGIGAVGKDLYTPLISTYLIVFLTDVFGIGAAAVGTLLLIGRIWDGINDPIAGIIVDKTNSHFGRFRPYLLYIPFILGAATIGLFSAPNLSPAMKLLWAYAFYILWDMSFTLYDVPIMSLSAAITSNTTTRTSLISSSRMWTLIAAAVAGIVALPVIKLLGGENTAQGYQLFTIILVVIAIPCSLLAFLNTRERVKPPEQKNSFKDYWNIIKTNQPFITIILSSLLFTIGFSTASGVTIYYITYYLKNTDIIPVILAVSILLPIPIMLFVPTITKRLGKKKTMIMGLLLLGVPIGIKFFFASVFMQILLSAIQGFGFAISMVVLTSMIADTVDFAEWKTRARSESVIFSISTFATKLGTAVAGAIIGYVLALVGYVPNGVQTQQSLMGINILYSLIPFAFIVIPVFLLSKYPLTEDKFNEITKELEQRRLSIGVAKD